MKAQPWKSIILKPCYGGLSKLTNCSSNESKFFNLSNYILKEDSIDVKRLKKYLSKKVSLAPNAKIYILKE